MNAGIITVGTEIIIGSILNTNIKYLSEKLSEIGVHVDYHVSVRDNAQALTNQIENLLSKVDILFLCGGLGPTDDDITKQVLANYLDRKLILDDEQYNKLINRFKKNKSTMTKNNVRQAYVIESSTILDNDNGTAPGELVEYKDKKIFLLPGPPREFEPMVDKYTMKYLINDRSIIIKSVNIAGLGESKVEDRLRKLNLEDSEVSLNTFARYYDTEVKIIAEGEDRTKLISKVDEVVKRLHESFGKNLYSEDNISLAKMLLNKLIRNNLTISFAESVTGGLLTSRLTSEAGASKSIKNSIITYSNEAKSKLLGVKPETLNKYGAVSKETAYEMAYGLSKLNMSDISVSVTGEAGPIKSEKDIGTVFVCYYFNENNYETKEYFLNGDRNTIQSRTVDTILLHLIFKIGGQYGTRK
ncbi:competence/damage-inducible protein A [Peptoniphilus catoniae]|uniref:competence/damage-inducible protein A n=1 Tax=Peptoniphilus catoniae TaxID=1660341 RepID=UPI0010FE7EE4|nr:competence/damage-inducible protein A [Peptoniphilus catoniae]